MAGLQQRSLQDSIEYLGLVAAHFPKLVDVPEGRKVTAQDLANAGIQVWRHESGTGHSYILWPGKISPAIQIFMPGHAARAIIRQDGWREAILSKQRTPAPNPAVTAEVAVPDAAAAAGDAPVALAAGPAENLPAATSGADAEPDNSDHADHLQQQQEEEEYVAGSPGPEFIAAAANAAGPAAATADSPAAFMDFDDAGSADSQAEAADDAKAARTDVTNAPSPADAATEATPVAAAAAAVASADTPTSVPSSSRQQHAGGSTPTTPTAAAEDDSPQPAAATHKRARSSEGAEAAAAAAGPAKRTRASYTTAAAEAAGGGGHDGAQHDAQQQQQPLVALRAAVSKRTRSADAADISAAAAAGDAGNDTDQPLAVLEAAVKAARGRTTPRRSSRGSGSSIPGADLLKSVEKYTSSTNEVQSMVQKALQQLQNAMDLATAVQSWSTDVLKSLPGQVILTRGLNSSHVSAFTDEAQGIYDNLQADAQQLDIIMKAAGGCSRGARRSSGGGSSGRQRSPAPAAAAGSPLRQPAIAYRSALEASCDDVHAWLKQQRQRELLDQLTALSDVKTLVEHNLGLKQQLQQQEAASAEREEQQRRREEDRLQDERDRHTKLQLEALLLTQKRQKARQQRNAEQRQQDQNQRQQRDDGGIYMNFTDGLLQCGNRDVLGRSGVAAGHVSPPGSQKAQVRAAAEALMVAARRKAAAVANGDADNATAAAAAGPTAGGFGRLAGFEPESDIEEYDYHAAAACAPPPPAEVPAAAAAAVQGGDAPAFPPNAPGSVLQFLQHLMKGGTGAANGIGHDSDDMSEDY